MAGWNTAMGGVFVRPKNEAGAAQYAVKANGMPLYGAGLSSHLQNQTNDILRQRAGITPTGAGSSSSTGTYSSMPPNSPLAGKLEGAITGMIDNPGLSDNDVTRLGSRALGGLATREAEDKNELSERAAAMGFSSSGDVMKGLANVSSDYSGQRNAIKRDIELGAAQDRLNRKESAVGLGNSWLNSMRTQNRADQAAGERMYGGGSGGERYGLSSEIKTNQFNPFGTKTGMDPSKPLGGGRHSPVGPTSSFGMPRISAGLQPGNEITSPWLADRRPDLVKPAAPAIPGGARVSPPNSNGSGGFNIAGFMPKADGPAPGGFNISGFMRKPAGTINGQPIVKKPSGIYHNYSLAG